MTSEALVVVALGGNAISPPGEPGTIEQQFQHVRRTAVHLAELVAAGYQLVITHGNGPQVGRALRRAELAAHEVHPLPLDICGADTQGGMGYMITQCVNNELHRRGIPRRACTILATVEVDPADPAFEHPSKPIGGFHDRQSADQKLRQFGWNMVEVPGQGYRRIVPSPAPRAVVEIDIINRLVRDGALVVTCGGGGVPVMRTPEGGYAGVEAVIDKDRTAALLADGLGAGTLVSATGVERVALHFGTAEERFVERMTTGEARRHLAAGQFPEGSMGPKIESAVEFVERRGDPAARAIICSMQKIGPALIGRSGTWIVAGD